MKEKYQKFGWQNREREREKRKQEFLTFFLKKFCCMMIL